MEGRKESKYNLAGTCPECGKLIKVEHIICVDIVEPGTSKKVEGKNNAENQPAGNAEENKPESTDVRPDNPKGKTGTGNSEIQSADSGNSKENKRPGGKTK